MRSGLWKELRSGFFASCDQTEDEGSDHNHRYYAEDDLLPTDRAGLLSRDRFLLFLLLFRHDLISGGMIPRWGRVRPAGRVFPTTEKFNISAGEP